MHKTISILGCGWLGLPLAQALLKTGFHIKGSTTTEGKLPLLKELHIHPFLVNIGHFSNTIDEFLKAGILIVALPSKNIDAFKNLLLKIENSPVSNVIFISSTSVYGDAEGIITEEFPARGALAVIEDLFKNSKSFTTTVLRFGGLVGGERQPGKFFLKGKVVPEPDARVNFIHRDDCIAIIQRVIEKGVWGDTFNCCADTHPTKREFYTKSALDIGLRLPEFADSNTKGFKIISSEKMKKSLDFEFAYPDLMDLPKEDF